MSKIGNTDSKRESWIACLALVAIAILGFWLRFRLLDVKDFWLDEYFTEDGAFYSFKGLIEHGHTKTTLLFSVIMKWYACAVTWFTGTNYLTPFQLRLPNVVFGTAFLFLVYSACRRIKAGGRAIAFFAVLLCATSNYLVYYSRDGRYYPFMLIWSALSFGQAVRLVFLPVDSPKQLKCYLLYSLFGILGFYSHYGFWVFFAVSNVAVCLIQAAKVASAYLAKKSVYKPYVHAAGIAAMALPFLCVYPLIHKMPSKAVTAMKSETVGHMLNSLAYSEINQNFFLKYWRDFPGVKYLLAVTLVLCLSYFLCKRLRALAAYLLAIKIGPFLLARLLPGNLVREPLRDRYFIFVIIADAVIMAIAAAMIVDWTAVLLSFKKGANKAWTGALAAYLVFASFACYSTLKLLDSSVYSPYKRPSETVKKLEQIWQPGDYVLTDDMEVACLIPYARKTDALHKKWNGYFIGWLVNGSYMPAGLKRIIVIADAHFNKYPLLQDFGNVWNLKFMVMPLPKYCSGNDILAMMGRVLSRTQGGRSDENLTRWSRIPSKAVDSLQSPVLLEREPDQLLVNSDFSSGLQGWKVVSPDGSRVYMTEFLQQPCVKIEMGGGAGNCWIIQSFNVEEGERYKFYAEVASDDAENKSYICCVFSQGLTASADETYCPLSPKKCFNSWQAFVSEATCKKSGRASVRVQVPRGKGNLYIRKVGCEKL